MKTNLIKTAAVALIAALAAGAMLPGEVATGASSVGEGGPTGSRQA